MEYKDHVTYSKVVLERHPTKRVCICGNICLKTESKCMTCKYDSSVTERSYLYGDVPAGPDKRSIVTPGE